MANKESLLIKIIMMKNWYKTHSKKLLAIFHIFSN